MRLVYSSDLHGNISFYEQLLELAVTEQATVAIVGGDLLPHGLRRETALTTQRTFVEQLLRPLLQRFKHDQPNLTLYTIPGNDDWAAAYQSLAMLEAEELLVDIHHRAIPIGDGLWLNGSGFVGLTPFAIKDYERCDTDNTPTVSFGQAFRSGADRIEVYPSEELLAQPSLVSELATLATQSNPRQTIYVFHSPPWQSQLDRRTGGRAVGSQAVRIFLEQHQPPIALHGHIHESPVVTGVWLEQIGATVAINPGQAQRGFHAVTLDTDRVLETAWHTVYGNYDAANDAGLSTS